MFRLEDETKARKELEKDVEDLKKTSEETRLNCEQTQKEIDLVKKELDRLKQEHKDVRAKMIMKVCKKCKYLAKRFCNILKEVDGLCDKIKDSEVKVEIESQNSNLAEMLNKIRKQYDKVAKKNQQETEEWYQNKVLLPANDISCAFNLHF